MGKLLENRLFGGTSQLLSLSKESGRVYNRQMKKVLIIEDDWALAKIYDEILEEQGLKTVTAKTGGEGLELASQESPDLIILDVMLPGGLNGFDVLETLRRKNQFKFTPVIVLTNLDSEKETALKIGATDYIVKANTSLDELVTKCKTLLKI